MLRVMRDEKKLVKINDRSLTDAGILERQDIQGMICHSPNAFFEEMGETLLLIGQEVQPSDVVHDRIDLLALQKDGTSVVIELKRNEDKYQLLQAISYASMISEWSEDNFFDTHASFSNSSIDDSKEEIHQFLDQIDGINKDQRIILIAESYDFSILSSAKWLTENYGVDIKCYRLLLSDDDGAEYLACSCIFPPPEISEHAQKRTGKKSHSRTMDSPVDWDSYLEGVTNEELVAFVRAELDNGRKNNLKLKRLLFSLPDRGVGTLLVQKKHALFWQYKRFENDEEFWTGKIGDHAQAKVVNNGKSLRFYLRTKKDFEAFMDAFEKELIEVQFY